jgi:hypothetical protein
MPSLGAPRPDPFHVPLFSLVLMLDWQIAAAACSPHVGSSYRTTDGKGPGRRASVPPFDPIRYAGFDLVRLGQHEAAS